MLDTMRDFCGPGRSVVAEADKCDDRFRSQDKLTQLSVCINLSYSTRF